ncbi:MAG: hypothetical protein ABL893_10695 [Hyphomicrobium sp.]
MPRKFYLQMFAFWAGMAVLLSFIWFGDYWYEGRSTIASGRATLATLVSPEIVYRTDGRRTWRYYKVAAVRAGDSAGTRSTILVSRDECRFSFDVKEYFAKPNAIVVDSNNRYASIPQCVSDIDDYFFIVLLLGFFGLVAAAVAHKMGNPFEIEVDESII